MATSAGTSSLPRSCTRIVFDVGCNDGADSLAYLEQGACVVAVDANPLKVAEATARLAAHGSRAIVLNAGIDRAPGNLTFYIPDFDRSVHASFDRAKVQAAIDARVASHRRRAVRPANVRTLLVPTVRCSSLWSHLPRARPGRERPRPEYMKVDIEERHYACVEALRDEVPPALRPRFVSWEMHEYAKGLPFPLLDTRLVLAMYDLGYTHMKVQGNKATTGRGRTSGAFSGGRMPDGVLDPRLRRDTPNSNTAWLK